MEINITKNTGFLEAPPRETDWIAGDATGLEYKKMNHFGSWTVFLPWDETQHSVYFDSMACVTFSALNSVEMQIRAHIGYQRLPKATLDFLFEAGYMDKWRFDASDRFTAKMSNTTRNGNYLVNVWDSIRKHGILPEKDYGYPREQRTPAFDWDDYYKEIPQALKDKALKFLDYFDVKYEWVPTNIGTIKEHLFQAPIQIAAPVCPGWNTDNPVKACIKPPAHATTIYRVFNGGFETFDSYNPCRKTLAVNYPINYALKGVVTPK